VNNPLTESDLIVRALEANGVDLVFGIPGTHNLGLYDALARSDIRHIAPRHEQGAGYAADGYARSTGRPGVLITTSGPGITNALTALGTAYADSVPVLAIAPGMRTDSIGKGFGQLHELQDQFRTVSSVVGRSLRAADGAAAARFLHEVFAEWRRGRRRPAYLEVPYDVLARASLAENTDPEPSAVPDTAEVAEAERAGLAAVGALLGTARRAVVVFGGGAQDTGDLALRFAEAADAVVVTTAAGKGVVPERYPASLGAVIDQGVAHDVLREADVLVVVGSELGESELGPNDWKPDGALVRVDVDETALTSRWEPQHALRMDAAVFLANALDHLGWGSERGAPTAAERAAAVRPSLDAALDAAGAQWRAVNELLAAALPADTIVSGDSSQVSYKGTMYRWPMAVPRRFLYPAGFATLGYGLPAAIGAKLANPDRPVIVLQGDGGLMFSIQEFQSAVEAALPIPVVVMVNGGYAEIREQMVDSGIPPLGTDLALPDFAALGRAMGGYGVAAADVQDVPGLVLEAFERTGPTLIEVVLTAEA
jgi:acetolactate synthase-1/2/3 large subunit